jgi:hypothetical protein
MITAYTEGRRGVGEIEWPLDVNAQL